MYNIYICVVQHILFCASLQVVHKEQLDEHNGNTPTIIGYVYTNNTIAYYPFLLFWSKSGGGWMNVRKRRTIVNEFFFSLCGFTLYEQTVGKVSSSCPCSSSGFTC